MGNAFNMYPVLSSDMIEAAHCDIGKVSFSYSENYDVHPLTLENENGTLLNFSAELRDPRCEWYPESQNLFVNKEITIHNPSVWFGKNGVVPHNAVLGLAFRWISVKSDHRCTVPFGDFTSDEAEKKFMLDYKFDKNTVKGSLLFQTIVYIKSSGVAEDSEKHLANVSGTVLGILDSCEIFVDGNGSVFPIANVNEPGKPLWWVYYDETSDPLQDSFDEEHVEIRLNRAHPCYESLKIESSLKESPLFLEVISSALMIIIDSAKEGLGADWDNVLNGQGFSHGSIAEAVYYFIVKLGWDTSSPTKLAQSIRQFFDQNLKGGAL